MATVKTVSVHYGRKQNLGDFNSANVECTVWADVERRRRPKPGHERPVGNGKEQL